MNKTLYVSDLDGTLLSTDSRISQKSSQIISELSDCGAMITVATARTPATVVPLLAQTCTRPPAVVMTGCAYWLRGDNCFDRPHFLPAHEVEAALDFCSRHKVHPFVYIMAPDGKSLDVYHAAKRLNKAEESFYIERSNLVLKRFHLGTPAPPCRRLLIRCCYLQWVKNERYVWQPMNLLRVRIARFVAIPMSSTPRYGILRFSPGYQQGQCGYGSEKRTRRRPSRGIRRQSQ